MRIEFITQDDPLYILPFFEEFLKNYAADWSVAQISSCPTMGSRSRRKMIRELTQLYGQVGFSRLVSRVMGSHLLGRLPLRPGASRYFGLRQLCNAYGVIFASIGNPNSPSFLEQVRARRCDLIVSVACPYILKPDLLTIPRLGCINIHHAPLPRYKGMMPTFWQLYHGETSVGLTIHRMVPKLDEGAALLQEQLQVEQAETLDHLIRRSKRHAAHALAKVLRSLSTGHFSSVQPSETESSYFTFPTAAEIREFRSRGLRAI